MSRNRQNNILKTSTFNLSPFLSDLRAYRRPMVLPHQRIGVRRKPNGGAGCGGKMNNPKPPVVQIQFR